MHYWLASSLTRHYPATPAGHCDTLTLETARGAQVSFQAVYRTGDADAVVTVTVDVPAGLAVRVRRVGYVPVPHFNTRIPEHELDGLGYLPGYVPDPLFPEQQHHAGAHETNAFWLTVQVAPEIAPGSYPVTVTLTPDGGEPVALTATVMVQAAVLPRRRDFRVSHIVSFDALCHWYRTEVWKDGFWPLIALFLADVAAHGQDTLFVPLFTPPLDGVKRPTQLLGVTRDGDDYHFDWSRVRRFVQMAQQAGITHFEWTPLFTQWGVQHAIRIYAGHGETGALLWPVETGATSPTYRAFLAQFLPAFRAFLEAEGVLPRSFFHCSDEPHGDEHLANYRAARALLRELAPWMPVIDALTDLRFAQEGLCDTPIPLITAAPEFVRAGFAPWTYYCCVPREAYLNRLLDTPLVKVAMSGWLFYRTQVRGFLHWGYNYWYRSQTQQLIDPFTILDGGAWPGWAYGDTLMVYPGPDGPIDSLRWEVWAESLQDYALLQAAGIDHDDSMLAAIHDYADFPRDEEWLTSRRRELLARCAEQQS